jgi:NADH:ubiquinone reductase (H+-translocating)
MEINIPVLNIPRVLIIGGGFGGIELAKKLSHKPVQVVLIDKNNYHTFQPLLYQVATAGLEPDSIAFPLRKIFKKQKNFFFRMACVDKVLPEKNLVITSIGEIHYDYLVLASGSTTNFFGDKNLESLSMGMKSIPEALNIRSLLLQNFEQALLTSNIKERESLMSVAIVGGGPTGVEMAGAIAELKNHILPIDYPELDIRKMQIHLIEAGPRVLSSFSENASIETGKFLKKMGVTIWADTRVKDFDGHTLHTNKQRAIEAKTVFWAAGVAGNGIDGFDQSIITREKRILVDEFNKVKGQEKIFAIGDIASMASPDRPKGHPMVAPVAMQQAHNLADNLVRLISKKSLKPFKYKDKGSMATVGRNKAIVDIGKFNTQGFFAWLIWMFIHLFLLIGFRNKVVVLVNWLWNYINYDTGIRLIIRPFKRKKAEQTSASQIL